MKVFRDGLGVSPARARELLREGPVGTAVEMAWLRGLLRERGVAAELVGAENHG
jgi:hypothetical protein